MTAKCLRGCGLFLVGLALATAVSYGADEKPSTTLPDVAAAAIKAKFTDANLGTAVLTKDLGFIVYIVPLDNFNVVGEGKVPVRAKPYPVVSTEVTADGTIVKSLLRTDGLALPDAAAKAVDAADDGAKVSHVDKYEVLADAKYEGPKFVPLAKPLTVYDVKVSKDDKTGFVRVDADGNVLTKFAWIAHAAGDVPAGKWVMRVNCGSIIDYTDWSGATWLADQQYIKGKTTWGHTDGQPHTAQRTGLFVLGTDAPGVYDCERYKMGNYHFDIPNGTYTVRLHYCESYVGSKAPGVRPFAVKMQGKVVFDKMDVAADAGFIVPLVKQAKDIEVSDGKLVIEQYTLANNDTHPFIDGIEIIQQ